MKLGMCIVVGIGEKFGLGKWVFKILKKVRIEEGFVVGI